MLASTHSSATTPPKRQYSRSALQNGTLYRYIQAIRPRTTRQSVGTCISVWESATSFSCQANRETTHVGISTAPQSSTQGWQRSAAAIYGGVVLGEEELLTVFPQTVRVSGTTSWLVQSRYKVWGYEPVKPIMIFYCLNVHMDKWVRFKLSNSSAHG